MHAVTSAGQNFVGITLVTDVPDQPVMGCVEQIVNCDRQFDYTKPGAKVTTGLLDNIDRVVTQFIGKLAQLIFVKLPKIGWKYDSIEERCIACHVEALQALNKY